MELLMGLLSIGMVIGMMVLFGGVASMSGLDLNGLIVGGGFGLVNVVVVLFVAFIGYKLGGNILMAAVAVSLKNAAFVLIGLGLIVLVMRWTMFG